MKLLIYWYADGDLRTRKFLYRELIDVPDHPEEFVIASMTKDAIWKNYSTWRVTEEAFEAQLRKPPEVSPGVS
jgi:hypothetical protein